jgi:hypothetical protein
LLSRAFFICAFLHVLGTTVDTPREMFAGIRTPTLVVAGAEGTTGGCARMLARALRHSRHAVLPGDQGRGTHDSCRRNKTARA